MGETAGVAREVDVNVGLVFVGVLVPCIVVTKCAFAFEGKAEVKLVCGVSEVVAEDSKKILGVLDVDVDVLVNFDVVVGFGSIAIGAEESLVAVDVIFIVVKVNEVDSFLNLVVGTVDFNFAVVLLGMITDVNVEEVKVACD